MVRHASGWFLALLAIMVTSCSSLGVDGAGGSSATVESVSVPTTEEPAESSGIAPEPPATGGNILVEFGRQGGIRGISDHLTVLQDGTVTVTRTRPASGGSGQLSTGELADLRQQLDALSATPLPKSAPAKGNDLYSYQVIYRDSEIRAEQGSVPPTLEPVIANLARIVAAYGS